MDITSNQIILVSGNIDAILEMKDVLIESNISIPNISPVRFSANLSIDKNKLIE